MASHGISRTVAGDRSAKAREQELNKIEKYNALVAEVQELRSSNILTQEALNTTSTLLSQNPEFNTIWNYRRLILLHLLSTLPPASSNPADKLKLLTSELTYLLPLLQSYPKCYWIWNYRKFLLQTATEQLDKKTALGVWKSEMGLVDKMLGRDSRNFHGWGYRRFVVASIEEITGGIASTPVDEGAEDEEEAGGERDDRRDVDTANASSMVESEFMYTTAMFRKNMSNFSAWHNRSKLIPRLLVERGANDEERRTFLDGGMGYPWTVIFVESGITDIVCCVELGTMHEALFTDPYDQSLHLYHHWLISSACSPKTPSAGTAEIATLTTSQKLETLHRVLDWMKELLEEEPDCRLLLEELIFMGGLVRSVGEDDSITDEIKGWLDKLMEVDPMRMGRWKEMAARL
ncbi:hypothetical protein ABW19_dt0210488 [Dactylella cylindrospora]|nr:hypothetical protein ABW19_dt0210488 [Dactylella cylindrospora]